MTGAERSWASHYEIDDVVRYWTRGSEKAENSESGDVVTPEEATKDPYVLEFLDLKNECSEADLEEGLIQRLTDFLLELGDDFAFVGLQRRLSIDDTWFRI